MTTEPIYEETYVRLQGVVDKLEAGDLPINEATTLYEEGLALAKKCNELLEATERKIRRVQQEQMAQGAEAGEETL